MNKKNDISSYEKILHWFVLLSFLGLVATALAAEYFFSKEAIMNSFKISLPMVGVEIPPVDQFFISRIERRNTWDVHFYFGLAFGIFIIAWIIINIFKRNSKNLYKNIFFTSGLALTITGMIMFLRLYAPLSEDIFGILKKIHYYGYLAFICTLILHIFFVIYKENRNSTGALSNMINFKFLLLVSFITLLPNQILQADEQSDFYKWINDSYYTEGVVYIEGQKGQEILIKEISNCPYDKCKQADVNTTQFGSKKIEIVKPNYKKAIELLTISSANGNALASNRLLQFLVKRIDYKSKQPNDYLLKQLEVDTSLTLHEYNKLIYKIINNGIQTNKSCYSEFLYAEINEFGLMEIQIDKKIALKHYEKANEICRETNLYKMLAEGKVNTLNKYKDNQ